MNRSPLEKASWIAGIISAAVAVWVLLFQSSSSAERSVADSPSQSQTMIAKSIGAPETTTVTSVIPTSTALSKTPFGACPTRQVIQETQKQAGNLSSFGARDEAYNVLVQDALCIGELQLATELAGKLSSYGSRDAAYAKVLDAAISSSNMELAEKLATNMSSYSARDDARRKIINAMRMRG